MRGHGPTLGAALLDYIRGYAGGPAYRSYTAVGWHAQIRQLTASPRGSQAADRAGLNPTARTLKRWLAGDTPTRANREKINEAYRLMGHRFPTEPQREEQHISGWICYGTDCRERGGKRYKALRIGKDKYRHDWSSIIEAWNHGQTTPEDLEAMYIADIIVPELGGAYPWTFPRPSYTVVGS